MNKRGLSLVELMAVIAIIGILAIMITPGIMSLRTSVLQSSYENKVSQIENAAKEYGQEHITELISPINGDYIYGDKTTNPNCIYRTVGFLINNGYLKTGNTYSVADERNNQFVDPRNNSSMNNLAVCIRFDTNNPLTREIVAYLIVANEG